jgi:II/X family phage/plasmid replication protein
MDKLYNKALELHRHLLKSKRKKEGVNEEVLSYVTKLIEYCESFGVVREEHSLRQALLKRHNLQFYGNVTEHDFYHHLKDIENAMKTIHISHDEHQSIADQLLSLGAVNSRQAANATQSYAIMWQQGTDIRQLLSQSNFYVHKARLKSIGIDIGQQFDVSRICPTLKRSEVIEVKPLEIPSWYKMPIVAETNVLPFKAYA